MLLFGNFPGLDRAGLGGDVDSKPIGCAWKGVFVRKIRYLCEVRTALSVIVRRWLMNEKSDL